MCNSWQKISYFNVFYLVYLFISFYLFRDNDNLLVEVYFLMSYGKGFCQVKKVKKIVEGINLFS